ncbi:MAG TPA: hypothetical protein VEH84_17660 [Alphaproteobacteria bacterium]|nr:hypothetical protein [Alphaproteobacteria bacterium]
MKPYDLTLGFNSRNQFVGFVVEDAGSGAFIGQDGEIQEQDRRESVRIAATDGRAAVTFARAVRLAIQNGKALRPALIGASGPFAKPLTGNSNVAARAG